MPTRITGPAVVVVDGGRIVAIEPTTEPVPDRTLAPGFVDLQVNGIGAVDVADADGDDWDELDRALLAQGVTTWCPTLVTAPLDSYAAPLARIAAAAERATEPACDRPSPARTSKVRSSAARQARIRPRSSVRRTSNGSPRCRRSSRS